MNIRKFINYFFTILILTVDTFPQSIDNFEDFPWCASQNNVRKFMLEFSQIKLNSEGPDFIVFENGKFGDYPVKYWDYRFYNDSLYTVIIVMDSVTIRDTSQIENLKIFIFNKDKNIFWNQLTKLSYLGFLYDSLSNTIGILEIDSNPSFSFGSRIRVILRYFPLLIELIDQMKFHH